MLDAINPTLVSRGVFVLKSRLFATLLSYWLYLILVLDYSTLLLLMLEYAAFFFVLRRCLTLLLLVLGYAAFLLLVLGYATFLLLVLKYATFLLLVLGCYTHLFLIPLCSSGTRYTLFHHSSTANASGLRPNIGPKSPFNTALHWRSCIARPTRPRNPTLLG